MTDGEIALRMCNARFNDRMRFVESLKNIWGVRSFKWHSDGGEHQFCDCMFYRDGDYAEAARKAGIEVK